ncbi:MAG: TetR/AcrR family transcriptional regulator [Candidatus Methanomethylophilaceae archaeon]|nr:TetR/AcrR family transcriptional regulator [Candidatus Methanomethylophilaceae archaeon]
MARQELDDRKGNIREETKQKIILGATELFLEQGYEKTTIRQIALKTGILTGSLYYAFKNKEDIFSEIVIEAAMQSIREARVVLTSESSMLDRILFPLCLEIYAAYRSPRIAELLAIASKQQQIRGRVIEWMTDWMSEVGGFVNLPIDKVEMSRRMNLCVGATGAMLESIQNDPNYYDVKGSMNLICEVYMNLLGVPTTWLSSTVDRIYDVMSNNEITICNIEI